MSFTFSPSADAIPASIDRIAFLDSNYSFDAAMHAKKLEDWLKGNNNRRLIVICYDDREIIGRAPAAGYTWAGGFWRWSGHEYVWTYGHWTHWTEGKYEGPRWVKVKGRWQWRDTTYVHREQVHEKWTHERTVTHREVMRLEHP